MLPQVSSIIAG